MKPVKLRLTLTVTLDPQGETVESLKHQLNHVVQHAVNNGLLTGETDATVEDYSYSIQHIRRISS